MIDSGFSPEGGAARRRTTLMDMPTALRTVGVNPDDVAQVVVTHAHYDHIGGLPAFGAAEVIMTRSSTSSGPGRSVTGRCSRTMRRPAEISHLRALRAAGRLTLTGRSHQVAPGIELTEVGGHTPGQAMVSVAPAPGGSSSPLTPCTTTRNWNGTGRSPPW